MGLSVLELGMRLFVRTALEMALTRSDTPKPPANCTRCEKFRVVGTGWYCGVSGKLLIPQFAMEVPVCRGKHLFEKDAGLPIEPS